MGDKIFRGQFHIGKIIEGNLMMRSCQERESFTNTFSTNLKTLNLKFFTNHKGHALEDKAQTSLQNYGSIYTRS